jgi:3-oxoacyl-[acyl-carrier protein] reductase
MDNYTRFANSTLGKKLIGAVGLPAPVELKRYETGQSLFTGNMLVLASESSWALRFVFPILKDENAKCFTPDFLSASLYTNDLFQNAGLNVIKFSSENKQERFRRVLFDLTGVEHSSELIVLQQFFSKILRQLDSGARVVLIGRTPEDCTNAKQATAHRALGGFVKALGKELLKGGTANLIYVNKGAEQNALSSILFFASDKSAYVSGQWVKVQHAEHDEKCDKYLPLKDKAVVVTGAARGIGEAIARKMASYGAKVICLDVPQAEDDLQKVAQSVNGLAFPADITAADTPEKLASFIAQHLGKLDALVHNAGITRDKLLANMRDDQWNLVMDINLLAQERMNDYFLEHNVFNKNARIVGVSSISGIAGNRGQTNYAASKAAVIGMVESMAPVLKKHDITINAVAPGFIETQMTAAIPFTIREAGRRMNSMAQGGAPEDVAEAIVYFASPNSSGVTGNLLRVCGQALIGA